MDISNKEILRSMVERKVENLLNSIEDIIMPMFEGNPAMGRIALLFISQKKKEILPQAQTYCDLLVETSCLDPDVTLADAIANAETTLNDFISGLIGEKLGVPPGTVTISLQILFGDGVFKL